MQRLLVTIVSSLSLSSAAHAQWLPSPRPPAPRPAPKPAPIAPIVCPEGHEAMPFSLFAMESEPNVSALPLLGATGFFAATPSPLTGNFKAEICFEPATEKATLQRVVLAPPSLGQSLMVIDLSDTATRVEFGRTFDRSEFLVPRSSVKVENLEAALFGRTGDFHVEIPLEAQTVFLSGRGLAGERVVAAGSAFNDAGVTWPGRVLVGTLDPGDAFPATDVCPFDKKLGSSAITVGTARLKLTFCSKWVGVGGSAYDILEVEVDDRNPNLAPEHRGKRKVIVEDAPAAVAWKVTHHNDCDSIRVALPGASYAWTNARAGECLGGVEDAPAVKEVVPGIAQRARVRYGTLPWRELAVPVEGALPVELVVPVEGAVSAL